MYLMPSSQCSTLASQTTHGSSLVFGTIYLVFWYYPKGLISPELPYRIGHISHDKDSKGSFKMFAKSCHYFSYAKLKCTRRRVKRDSE